MTLLAMLKWLISLKDTVEPCSDKLKAVGDLRKYQYEALRQLFGLSEQEALKRILRGHAFRRCFRALFRKELDDLSWKRDVELVKS